MKPNKAVKPFACGSLGRSALRACSRMASPLLPKQSLHAERRLPWCQKMKTRTTWVIALLAVSSSVLADENLWGQLQNDPNMVVLMRNAESSGNRDGSNMLAWDSTGKCAGESTLTPLGREQAKKIGAAFSERGVKPIVISSPMCRCKETARIAFGEYETDPGLRQSPVGDAEGQEVFHATASGLLRKHRGKLPIVFVNHRPNIDAMTMELVKIGELLVGSVAEDGEIEVLGKILLEQ